MKRLLVSIAAQAVFWLAFAASCAIARQGEPPYSLVHRAKVGMELPVTDVPALDAARRRTEMDAAATASGSRDKRLLVADDSAVSITPQHDGVWTDLPDGSRLWRIRVRASGATDLRLGFGHYALPAGATLHIIGADDYYQGPYTAADAYADRFQAPVVPGDSATIELHLPAGETLASDAFELTSIGAGFRDAFGRDDAVKLGDPGASGSCNVNVVCPLGQGYPDEIRAVAYVEFQDDDNHNYYLCSGTLLADVPRDRRNYFLTAAHCIDSAAEAASLIAYWNYESTQCGFPSAPSGGYFNDDQHAAALRATRADVDFTLLELNQPPDAAWNVYYAGWDADGAAPAGTVGIHHPSGDVKKITAGPTPTTTDNCIDTGGSSTNTHWLTGPYLQGTTEGGSSGSGLFASSSTHRQARRLIGTLSGGDAACSGALPNAGNDCYGKFAVAWNGASAAARLRDWLDPANSGTTAEDGGDTAPPIVHGHSRHAFPAPFFRPSAAPHAAD
ncbi:MAG: hypothetical protein ABI843_03155 [Dokdonella sp.]